MVKLKKKSSKNTFRTVKPRSILPVVGNITNKKKTNLNVGLNFNEITHEQQHVRNQAVLQLLQKIDKTWNIEQNEKEVTHTLKRLVRGCSATSNNSRAGFYTALVGLLKIWDEEKLPLHQVIEIMHAQLTTRKPINNKEDADDVLGKIVVCGAILHSGRISQAKTEDLNSVLKCLIDAAKQRSYHSYLAYNFIVFIVEVLPQDEFKKTVWPLLQQELTVPWPKQNLQTVYCLMTVQQLFPELINAKFCKQHFGMPTLLNTDSFDAMFKIFWQHKDVDILMYPAFHIFAKQLAKHTSLAEFWLRTVDANLGSVNKRTEIVTIAIATGILKHIPAEQKSVIIQLLSENFMKVLIAGLKRCQQKKYKPLKVFYNNFFDALCECCSENIDDTILVTVIRRLVLPPGSYSIEKYAQVRILHKLINHLSAKGVEEIYELFKNRFLNKEKTNNNQEDNNVDNVERASAGFMLQQLLLHKKMQQAYAWRLEQLLFLFTAGIFHINEDFQICNKEEASSFSREFGEQCELMFYASMPSNITDLAEEKQLLKKIVNFADKNVSKIHWNTEYMRIRLKETSDVEVAWSRVLNMITAEKLDKCKNKKNDDNLQLVFDILILHMCLRLYYEPEMSVPAIDDLYKCIERIQVSKNHKKNISTEAKNKFDESEWIEVVLDLLLHLLSQNSSTLHNIVTALFPHLCSSLTVSGVHQLLTMLHMKDGANPPGDDNEEEEAVEEVNENESSSDEEESEAESNDMSDEEIDEVDILDAQRIAVSQALMAHGAGDDDMDSIDLNDISEEDGRRLDEALSAAFHAMKRGGENNTSKKSKVFRLETKMVIHFRIRVLDLLDIYLQQLQPQLIIVVEIMLSVLNMLEYCISDDLVHLRTRVLKLLNKLTNLNECQIDPCLNVCDLMPFMRQIVENRIPAAGFNIINPLRNKCIPFLFAYIDKLKNNGTEDLHNLWRGYVQNYVTARNPIVNITLWNEVFGKLRWNYLFELIVLLGEQGINLKTRIFRRVQILEVFCAYYRNRDLQAQDKALSKKTAVKIELILLQHLQFLAQPNEEEKRSSKEFQTLLELILLIKGNAEFFSRESILLTTETISLVQQLRLRLRLESMQAYHRYCNAFSLPVIKNENMDKSKSGLDEMKPTNDKFEKQQIQLKGKKRKLETNVEEKAKETRKKSYAKKITT